MNVRYNRDARLRTYLFMKHTIKSFLHALKGILFALRHERNFQLECVIAGVVIVLMLWLPLLSTERALLLLTMTVVLSLELINTALERVMDILKPRVHPYARVVKDVIAGAVLLASFAAVGIGACIFIPYFLGN